MSSDKLHQNAIKKGCYIITRSCVWEESEYDAVFWWKKGCDGDSQVEKYKHTNEFVKKSRQKKIFGSEKTFIASFLFVMFWIYTYDTISFEHVDGTLGPWTKSRIDHDGMRALGF